MWNDEISEEIYKSREEHAKAFEYDLRAICEDLRKRQVQSGRKIVSKPLRKPRHRNNSSLSSIK
nr:hypothetical protein [Phormidium sp. FACHB-1136]